jgi:hypothetical protein
MANDNEPPAPRWKCVLAALPMLLVGLEFLRAAQRKSTLFGATPRDLTAAMQAEFLVIHSMAFLGALALWRPEGGGRVLRAVLFWALFAFYCWMAAKTGRTQLAVFVGLTFATYFGLFMTWRSPSAMVQLAARWFVGFVLFIFAAKYFDAPSSVNTWDGRREVLRAGALYFFLLAAVEITGFYLRTIPRNAERILAFMRSTAANRRTPS